MKKKIYFLSMRLNILNISTLRPECILYHKLKVVFFYVHFSTLAEFFLQKTLAGNTRVKRGHVLVSINLKYDCIVVVPSVVF